ncbi:chlorophyll synthase ChlG [Phenylobacterium sp.]|uniref:chlorophyll synthase ChlG n=1 Tax=Phenylobacterium sp. TaxID=1871053 RepID=UPI0025D87D3A|nr:chlorophyll synthase ChlG [Phenylobacterium sp.]
MSGLDVTLGSRDGSSRRPSASAVLELLKPVTWFAPVWAFMCGVVSSGASLVAHWPMALAGMVLAGPAICAASQAANDWFDRHVDAINEPNRPIPSGRIPGRWGLWIAIIWTALSLLLAASLGPWVLYAALIGLALAWAYSAPPLRLKQAGWWGPISVAICYEGLAWFTGAAVMTDGFPDAHVVVLAGLYSFGAVGIMVFNDFKAVEGDRQMNILSVPVDLGVENAAWLACIIMAAPQVVVATLLVSWGLPLHAAAVGLSLAIQCGLMVRLLGDPRKFAPWFNATGTLLYVLGMLVSAFAVGAHIGAPR